jgi:hypothetical protein
VWWLAALGAASPPCPIPAADDPEVRSALYAAQAHRHVQRGEVDRALVCTGAGLAEHPTAGLWMDHARALAEADRLADALIAAERAEARGHPQDETRTFMVPLLEATGRTVAARASARESGSLVGRLWAAALSDPASARDVARRRDGGGRLAPYTALALAHFAARSGRSGSALSLAEEAERGARRLAQTELEGAARRFQTAVRRQRPNPGWDLRVAVGSEVLFNPRFEPVARTGAALGTATVEGGLHGQVGRVRGRLNAALTGRVPWAEPTPTISGFGLVVGAMADMPISSDPTSAVVQLGVRSGLRWLNGFSQPVGSWLEVGPSLWVPFGGRWRTGIGAYGVRLDVSERLGAPDDSVDPRNRDAIGQRAVLSLERRTETSRLRLDAFFASDQADGAVFDAVGGGGAARVEQHWSRAWSGAIGGHAALRDFGPSDVPSVLGGGDKVLELRTSAWFALSRRFAERWRLTVRGQVIDLARDGGPDATWGGGSVEWEARW